MEQVNEAQPQSQPPSQRFYALEQLGELAGTITLISEGLQAYRLRLPAFGRPEKGGGI